jgi:hypothetical protein
MRGDRAAIAGVILDASSGKPPQKTEICAMMRTGETWVAAPCVTPDSLGQYRLDNLLLTTVQVWITCETVRNYSKTLAKEMFSVSKSEVINRDWRVSMDGCDFRPIRRVTRIFTGFYQAGLETSEFIPCPVDFWALPSDSLAPNYNSQRAWVSWAKGAGLGKAWPSAPRDSWGNPQYYVRWHGTLEGPGQYGHFGMSPFSFRVDSVLELRAPHRGDCGLGSG